MIIFCSCKTTKTVQKSPYGETQEKFGIIVSINKENNWFIPLIEYDGHKDAVNNLREDNLQIGFNLQYQIDDILFSFINGKIDTKVIFVDKDSVRRELIPVRIRYRKLTKASDDSCEIDIHANSFYYQDQLVEYKINSCVYLCLSIKPLIFNK